MTSLPCFHSYPASHPGCARNRWAFGVALALALAPAGVAAQAMAEPLVPRGRVRFDLVPSITSWDTRYGLRSEGGKKVEEDEKLGMDLTDPRGVSLFPGVQTLEEAVRKLSGDDGFQGSVGATSARLQMDVTRIDMGLRIGVFDWLTVGGNVPYVKGVSTLDLAFRPDTAANLGLNPASASSDQVSALLTGLGEAATAAAARAQTVCAGGSGADCAAAQALATRTSDFWNGTFGAYFASPFFPLGTAPVAARLRQALAALDGDLVAAGLQGVGRPMVFASKALDQAGFLKLPSDPASGIEMTPVRGYPGLWQLGDVEVNATVRVLEGEVRDSAAVSPRFAWALYGGLLVRLPTGVLDDPNVFLDLASGDGQQDIEGRVDGELRVGPRFDVRGAFRYGTQGAVDVVRRVAAPEALLPPASSARVVRWTPGAYWFVELSPRLHLGEVVSFAADFRQFTKGKDTYELVGEEPAGSAPADLSLLSRETEVTLRELALGLRYSSVRLFHEGRVGTPAEVGVRWVRPLSGSGGQAPKASRVEISVSLFRRIWG